MSRQICKVPISLRWSDGDFCFRKATFSARSPVSKASKEDSRHYLCVVGTTPPMNDLR
jgi:hypothetical protein